MTEPTAPDHDDVVIDLRDPAPSRPPSGRPADLLPGHRLVTITRDDPEAWHRAESFVYDIYREIGYCDESPLRRVEELAVWDHLSEFHAVVDADDAVIGVVRTICGRFEDLPVAQFDRTDFDDADPVCELSSLTVRTDVRSTGVIEHLYRAGWLASWRAGSTAVVALIDDWLFEVFRDTYRLPFRQIGVGRDYMGSHPLPVAMPLAGSAYALTATQNPEFWAWTLEALEADEVAGWDLPPVPAEASAGVPARPTSR